MPCLALFLDHWFNLIFISKFITCMDTRFGGPYNFSLQYMVVKLCTVCFQDVIDNIQTCFQYIYTEGRPFVKKITRKSWVFVTNVPNDLSRSVYLDVFASHV